MKISSFHPGENSFPLNGDIDDGCDWNGLAIIARFRGDTKSAEKAMGGPTPGSSIARPGCMKPKRKDDERSWEKKTPLSSSELADIIYRALFTN